MDQADQAGPQPFFLDNADERGWLKVTEGRGGPAFGHRSLPVAEELGPDDTAPPSPRELAAAYRRPETGGAHNPERQARKHLARQLGLTGKALRRHLRAIKRAAGPTEAEHRTAERGA